MNQKPCSDRQIRRLQKKAQKRPDDARSWLALSRAFHSRGARSHAVSALITALGCEPDELAICLEIGDLFRISGECSGAREAYQRACRLSDRNAAAYARLGSLHLATRDSEAALRYLEVAYSLDGRSVDILLDLVTALLELGRLSDAERHLDELRARRPSDPRPLLFLGQIYGQRGEKEAARTALETAHELAPRNPQAMTSLAIILTDLGQHDRAIRLLTTVVELLPESADALLNLGLALYEGAYFDEALRYLRKAIDRAPESAVAHSNFGLVLQAKGELESALSSFRRAVAIEPTWPLAHYHLGRALVVAGQSNEAQVSLSQAQKLAPELHFIQSELDSLTSRGPSDRVRTAIKATIEPEERESPVKGVFAGDLSVFPLPDILEFLRQNRRSGTLWIKSKGQTAGISLVEGRIAATFAPRVYNDLKALSATGVKGARSSEREAIQDVLLDLVSWESGDFSFGVESSPHGESDEDAGTVEIDSLFDTSELLIDTLRRFDETQRPS